MFGGRPVAVGRRMIASNSPITGYEGRVPLLGGVESTGESRRANLAT